MIEKTFSSMEHQKFDKKPEIGISNQVRMNLRFCREWPCSWWWKLEIHARKTFESGPQFQGFLLNWPEICSNYGLLFYESNGCVESFTHWRTPHKQEKWNSQPAIPPTRHELPQMGVVNWSQTYSIWDRYGCTAFLKFPVGFFTSLLWYKTHCIVNVNRPEQ